MKARPTNPPVASKASTIQEGREPVGRGVEKAGAPLEAGGGVTDGLTAGCDSLSKAEGVGEVAGGVRV